MKNPTKAKTLSGKSPFTALRSLEEEIKFLKANFNIRKLKKKKNHKGFASLEGIWKGKTNFSYEDIKSAEIKLKGL